MSRFTSCNHCDLERLKKKAQELDMKLTVIHNNVFVYPKDVDFDKLDPKERDQYFRMWFMSITDHCVC